MKHYGLNLRKNDVSHNVADNTFSYHVNGGLWTVASGSDIVFAYDADSNLIATYTVSYPVTSLDMFDNVVDAMMDAGVTL